MTVRHDYYEILRVSPQASGAEIRASYRTIVQQLSTNPGAAKDYASLSLINQAFRTLGDPSHRADYDRQRQAAVAAAMPVRPVEPAAPAATAAVVGHVASTCPFCESSVGASASDCPDAACPACAAPLYPAQQHTRRPESRREMERLPLQLRASYRRAAEPSISRKGISQDVSLAGMRLMTSLQLEVGERISIDCEFCTAVGIVRHVRASTEGDGFWEAGIQFLTLHVKHTRGGLLSTMG